MRRVRQSSALLSRLWPSREQATLELLALAGRYNRKPGALRVLEHALSAHASVRAAAVPAGSRHPQAGHDPREVAAFHRHSEQLREAVEAGRPRALADALAAICSTATGSAMQLRRQPVFTTPDAYGARWRYPDPPEIGPGLARLSHYLRHADDPPLVKACVAHAMVASLHPFLDGNGRTSRVVFNALLPQHTGPAIYIPCKRFYELSHHGYDIRVRLVHMKNDWRGLILYFCDMVEAYQRTMRRTLFLAKPVNPPTPQP